MWRDFLAFHQERVRSEYRVVAHGHAVVDEGSDANGAARTDSAPVRLKGAILLRVALDFAPRIERAVIADGDQGPLGEVAAVVE